MGTSAITVQQESKKAHNPIGLVVTDLAVILDTVRSTAHGEVSPPGLQYRCAKLMPTLAVESDGSRCWKQETRGWRRQGR